MRQRRLKILGSNMNNIQGIINRLASNDFSIADLEQYLLTTAFKLIEMALTYSDCIHGD